MKRILIIILLVTAGIPLLTGTPVQEVEAIKSRYTNHDPIEIIGNENFTTEKGVTNPGAAGTEEDPYIIAGWNINTSDDKGIYIENTDAYFIITDCYFINEEEGGYSNIAIEFEYVENGKIENIYSTNNNYGVILRYCNHIRIANNTCNGGVGGIRTHYSNNLTIINNSCYDIQKNGDIISTSFIDSLPISWSNKQGTMSEMFFHSGSG